MPTAGRHLYVCGPPSFMEFTMATAAARGWSPELIHSESFVRPSAESNGAHSLTVYLARSKKLLQVQKNQSILDAVRAAGIQHQSSCELRSEEHTSELQSLMRISYAVFCLKKKTTKR